MLIDKKHIPNKANSMKKTNKKNDEVLVADNKFAALSYYTSDSESDNEESHIDIKKNDNVVNKQVNETSNTKIDVSTNLKKSEDINKSQTNNVEINNVEINRDDIIDEQKVDKKYMREFEWKPEKRITDWKTNKDKFINKQLYLENNLNINNDIGNNLFLSSNWTVWCHRSDCPSWTKESYINIYTINSIGSFWRFFNNFHLFDKLNNQFFIMRDQIYPIWEDNNNRLGGIYSIKIDCYSRTKSDIGSEVMTSLCLLMMNETLVPDGGEINGISYSNKTRNSTLIKIWYKDCKYNINNSLPVSFFEKLNSIVRSNNKLNYNKKMENRVTTQIKAIKPEYEI